jgi:thiamine-monophosphate kinase
MGEGEEEREETRETGNRSALFSFFKAREFVVAALAKRTEMGLLTVRELGEQGLLQRIQRFCPMELVGDDAAILNLEPGRSLVVTTDVLVDGVHFSERTTSAVDAGWRAVAANLSDLAAMGAEPLGITVGLGLPGDCLATWVEQLYTGMVECLQRYRAVIMGGDVVRSPVITLSVTALGQVDPNRIIRRSAAQPGQVILVTGEHGASRAGLELLLDTTAGRNLSLSDRTALMRAHQRPVPRLNVLSLLKATVPFPVAIAGMDSSDGLADAIIQICRASGVGARVFAPKIPIPPPLQQWVTPEIALEWALYGGEDFELVLCLLLELANHLVSQDHRMKVIGEIIEEPHVWLVDRPGTLPNVQLTLAQGFQHFTAE